MHRGLNILSLFDGASCGKIALERAGVKVDKYFASEIKPYAINHVSKKYPDTIQLGDVRNIHYTNWGLEIDTKPGTRVIEENIDLLIGGSPCRGVSGLNQNQEGLQHKESILFWEYYRILNEIRLVNPKVKFFLEITHGNKEATDTITNVLKVEKISVNSRLVSAQNRPRYYWTNIEGFVMPKDKGITTDDVFRFDGGLVPENRIKWLESESGKKSVQKGYTRINPYPKSGCITASGHKKWNENYLQKHGVYRFLSVRELEALQTFPEGYCDGLSYDDAYDLIGDGWTIDVVTEFFKPLKQLNP